MKKGKNSHHTTKNKESEKVVVWEEYLDTISWQMAPASNQTIDRLIVKLMTWVTENERAYTLEEFFDLVGVEPRTAERWAHKDEKLKSAMDKAKRIIGRRREYGALEKKLNPETVHFVMPHYSPIWKDVTEWRNKIKEGEDGSKQIIVQLSPFKESDDEKPAKLRYVKDRDE